MINRQTVIELARRIKGKPFQKWKSIYETATDSEEKKLLVLSRAYFDLKFFALFFFNKEEKNNKGQVVLKGHCKDPFNKMHIDYFQTFDPEAVGETKVIRAFRGSAKTTMIALIDALHRMLFANEFYTIILSSTKPLSVAKTTDISSELVNNHRLKAYFNLILPSNRISRETCSTKTIFGEAHIQSQGFFSQIRGLKKGSERPTRFIYDDVTHGERVFSKVQRMKAKRQFYTDIKNASQPDSSHIFIGTTIHSDDLLTELSNDTMWFSKTYQAVLQWPTNMDMWDSWGKIFLDHTVEKNLREEKARQFYHKNKKKMDKGALVAWPERESLYHLMRERRFIGKKAFNAEKQMIPFLEGETLFSKIHWFHVEHRDNSVIFNLDGHKEKILYDLNRFEKYYALDPATGERKKAQQQRVLSQSARIIAYKDLDTGRLFVMDVKMDREQPSKIIKEMFDLHLLHKFKKIGFEKNLFQDLFENVLQEHVKEYENETGRPFYLPTVPIWNKEKKEERIYTLEPAVTSGMIIFNKDLPHDFITQISDYPHCDTNDGLDALEIIQKITSTKEDLQMFATGGFATGFV